MLKDVWNRGTIRDGNLFTITGDQAEKIMKEFFNNTRIHGKGYTLLIPVSGTVCGRKLAHQTALIAYEHCGRLVFRHYDPCASLSDCGTLRNTRTIVGKEGIIPVIHEVNTENVCCSMTYNFIIKQMLGQEEHPKHHKYKTVLAYKQTRKSSKGVREIWKKVKYVMDKQHNLP